MYYLSRREHSRRELTDKLLRKKYPITSIESVLSELSSSNLQSDHRYSESYTRQRRNKGYGPLRISAELQAKGVNPEIIAEVVQIADNAWFTDACNTWRKHFKNKPPSTYNERAKHARFMQYKGFTQEQLAAAIPAYLNDDN